MERQQGAKAQQAEQARGAHVAAANARAPEQTPEQTILQLQRSLGNRAVGQLLGGSPPAERPSGHPAGASDGDGEGGDGPRAVHGRLPLAPSPAPFIQRKCACGAGVAPCAKCGDEGQERAQLKPENGASAGGPKSVSAQSLAARLGAGRPLDAETRALFEPRFGYDFASVRVHDDAEAEASARSMRARAFTFGHHVVFRGGQYSPTTDEGRRLLGHELAHVVQQSGGASGVQAAGLGEDDYEREADSAAERALAGHVVGALTPVGASLVQRQGDEDIYEDEDIYDEADEASAKRKGDEAMPPYVDMEASVRGLRFVPEPGDKYKPGPRIDQANARMLRRLVGDEYQPELLKAFDAALKPASGYGEYGNVSGVAQGGEGVGPWVAHAPFALKIIQWLQDGSAGRRYEVYISPAQLELLKFGLLSHDAWQDLRDFMQRRTRALPEWYTESMFAEEMASHGKLLRDYEASTKPPTDEPGFGPPDKEGVLEAIYDAISEPAWALDLIRADHALTGHNQYPKLWPSTRQAWQDAQDAAKKSQQGQPSGPQAGGAATAAAAAPPPVQIPVAAENSRIDFTRALLFLAFIRTQKVLRVQVFEEPPAGDKARLELLDRFDRFYDTATARRYGGDQRILEHPAGANAPPFPARLYAYPALQAPFFDASTATVHNFYIEFVFRKIFEGFTSFKFQWDMFRVPDERFINTATLNEKQRVETTWGEIYSQRFARDSRYAAADVARITRHMDSLFGPPGMSTYDLVQLNNLLRYAGTGFQTFTEQIANPESIKPFWFKEEGLHVVRCAAVPFLSENAEVVRPPSVAYLPVFARKPEKIGETRVRTAMLMQEAAAKRRDEVNKLLQGNPPDRAALEEELKVLNSSLGTVKDTLTYQKEVLEKESAASVPWKQASLDAQAERIGDILETREKRGLDKVKTERLVVTHVADLGDVLQLVLEVVDQTQGAGPPFEYYIADATTPSGKEDKGTGATRKDAILSAVKNLMEKSEYGRGITSVLLDDVVHPIRVEASGTKMMMEALGNFATLGSLIAVAAAPFTGGASLAFLVPLGVVGAIPSAYNLVTRIDDKTFRWDMTTAMDMVNVLGAVAGVGAEAALSRAATSAARVGQAAAATQRILTLSKAFALTGIGSGGLGVVLMSVQFYEQVEALKHLPPGMRSARLLQIVGRALVDVGIQAGGILADKARLRAAEEAVGSRPVVEGVEGVEASAQKPLAEAVGQKTVESLGGDAVTLLTETHTPGEVKTLVERVGAPAARELAVSAGREGLEAVGSRGLRELVDAVGESGVRRLLKTLADLPDLASRSLRLAQEWVAKVVKLPASIVERLFLDAIKRLRELPFWIRERLADMREAALEALLGCSSPCHVDQQQIIEYFSKMSAGEKAKAKPLKTVQDVLDALPPDINRTKIENYLKDPKRGALMKLIEAAGITDLDLKKLGDFFSDADKAATTEGYRSAYRTFVRYLTQMLPSKTGKNIKLLNQILAQVIAAEPRQGAALKGPAFEAFVRQYVPKFAGTAYQRVSFDKGGKLKLEKTRTSDFFIVISEALGIRSGELWDFKHTDRVDPKQAGDYSKIKNHTDPKLDKVTSVNYLFPEYAWAKSNEWLIKDYGFNLFYLDEFGVMQQYIPGVPPP
ncbi:MAG TPA: DUF4157 domain-containing protein [Pyrinomonadaceae bacterium]|nr:DUF4157 domain-containing protein [Pyrinomonadaceae bacterium]